MADERWNLQGISWSETFPFVRLFSTFKRAISFWPLMLGFSCVFLTYVSGRVLDAVWTSADAGVLAVSGARHESEVAAYAALDQPSFDEWLRDASQRWERLETDDVEDGPAEREQQVSEMLALIDTRLESGLELVATSIEAIEADGQASAEDKESRRQEQEQGRAELRRAADILRLTLTGHDVAAVGSRLEQATAISTVLDADPDVDRQQRADEQGRLATLLAMQSRSAELKMRGPFISLLDFEMDCFAAAIQGVCSGRWGLSGPALSNEPAMIGSIASAGSGVWWLVTQRPWFAVIFAIVLLVIQALFGGAICRVAAVRSAREESTSYAAALSFSREKLAGSIAAPLLPAGMFVVAGLCIFVGGLVAAIWGLHTIAGVLYGLSLLGGVVLTFTLLAVVLGFHLMWPTIAVEGSDAFDAVQRAAGYVFGRPWHTAFYSFVLLLYGGVSFVMVRIIAMLVLKLSHVFTGAGMNLAGSAETSTIGRLDAIWHMPAWQDLPLLPATGDVNFWGSFGNAPLSGAEGFTMFFIALWVFLVVGLVGAFVVSFYFCGSTEMYFLLRREVDAVDYDEIYYEELEDELDEEEQPEAAEPEKAEEPQEPPKPKRRPRAKRPKAADKPEKKAPKPPADDSSSD